MKYCIIGNGTAGIEGALAIRDADSDGEIQILSASKYPFYFRPKLIDYIRENFPREKLFIYKEGFLESKKIEIRSNICVTEVRPEEKTVRDRAGNEFRFDRLLLAVGASPYIPEIENGYVEGVFTLRGIDDAEKIRTFCRGRKNIVISGGGLLGIETAFALREMCESVTVIDMVPRLLSRQLDDGGSSVIRKFLERQGLQFLLGDCVKKILGESSIREIELVSGGTIDADALVISAGIRSNVNLASSIGLTIGRGIAIDDMFRTSVEDIYAAGDCAEHAGIVYGLWNISKEQGKIAGWNMAGRKQVYHGSVPSTVLKVTGIDLFSAGDFTAEGSVRSSLKDDTYIRFVSDGDRPIGAIVIGDPAALRVAQKVMAGKAPVSDMIQYIG
jgi:nitrite reductase (NADH) large subunit